MIVNNKSKRVIKKIKSWYSINEKLCWEILQKS